MITRLSRLWHLRHDDDGFSLTELLVSMSIMAIVMVMVTAGVLQASDTSARVEAAGLAQSQVHQAFDTLDRQVRWAAAISTPGKVGPDPYVEFLYTAGVSPTCYELRLNAGAGQLQERNWLQGANSASAWLPLASAVTATTGAGPFTTTAAGGAFPLTRLRIAVTSTAGGAKATVAATSDVTFTALNSGGGISSSSVCTEGRLLP